MQTWKNNFNHWSEHIRRLAIWVRLPRLPIDYYDKKFFYSLGNQIGKAIRIDEMTLQKARTLYARICVEIDLSQPLLPSYIIYGNPLKIKYEGLQIICFHCGGRFGQTMEQCSIKKGQETLSANVKAEEMKQGDGEGAAGIEEEVSPKNLVNA